MNFIIIKPWNVEHHLPTVDCCRTFCFLEEDWLLQCALFCITRSWSIALVFQRTLLSVRGKNAVSNLYRKKYYLSDKNGFLYWSSRHFELSNAAFISPTSLVHLRVQSHCLIARPNIFQYTCVTVFLHIT